jgi:hypothetical protein
MSRPKEIHTIVVLLLLLSALPLSATLVNPFEDELRKSVMALDHARYRAVHDLDQKKQSAGLEAAEQQDYEKFIMYLTVRISEYCQQLTAEQGEAATTGLPCPTGNQALLDRQDATTPTSKEEVAELEKLLSESLGQFDEDLLKEEEQIATRRPKDRETGYGYGSSGGGGGAAGGETGTGEAAMQAPGSSQESADEGIAGQGSEGGGKDSPQTGKETGGSASGMGAGVAAGKESGQGTGSEKTQAEGSQSGPREFETGYDDIVARQLREAAEKETDPELKKKLWEEYRKYKEGVH